MAALAAYRNLWRATRVAFQGDTRVMNAAREQIRDNFRQKRSLASSDPSIQTAIQHAEEVAVFLRANVVQGKKDGETYKLRIHEDTERGDNDTIKVGNQTITIDGKTCKDR